MKRLMGLETEYGLYIEGIGVGDLAAEARKLVKSGPSGVAWDYRGESPLQDLRGFRAPRLATNPLDDQYERLSRTPPPRTPQEDHVDRVLKNGARFYHDHGHPEYSTPECLSLKDLVAHDRAGERIVWACAQAYQAQTGRDVAVYKNNTDYHGMSYGCHENYLVRRDLPFERLVGGLLPFLVTRVLYCGAGKVGSEEGSVLYQLSQRADFFDEVMSIDTLHRRPLINTRDEPHADRRLWRRLHIICGDANLSEYVTALKVGTTALVLDVLEAGYGAPVGLKDPVAAIRRLSRELEGPWLVELSDGKTISAIEIQRAYLAAACELFAGRDEETDWVLAEWEAVLDALEKDPKALSDRLDWAAKQALLEAFLEAEGLSWEDDLDLLRSLELEYHNLDPGRGLFQALEGEGKVKRLVGDGEIEEALRSAPKGTRAHIRGLCVRNFEVRSASWGRVVIERPRRAELDLTSLVDGIPDGELAPDAAVEDVIEWVAQWTRR